MAKNKKNNLEFNKLRGGYYTPIQIADFICKWAIDDINQTILEPSCGDGNFIGSIINRFKLLGANSNKINSNLTGIELIEDEANKTKEKVNSFGLNPACIINNDFFTFLADTNGDKKYDIVVGNPPFIRYQNFPEAHRDKAFKMMAEIGLKPNKLTNIWAPFLVLSSSILSENGKLGFVIPAELFQVKYAEETRVFLSNFFSRITIITFKKLVFKDIQQEVVLLLCEKNTNIKKGIRVVELNNLEDLDNLDISIIQNEEVKVIDHSKEKWTKYFLNSIEIEFLRKIKLDDRIKLASEIMITNVGLVTGINEFFMLNEEDVLKWKIKEHTIKVIGRSNHLKGVFFDNIDFDNNANSNIEGYLFFPPDKDYIDLSKECQDYIKYGESKGYHLGYKCRIRKRWYITPSIYSPDAFALRQVGDYPKIVLNNTLASSTDTIHRIRFKDDYNPKLITVSFLNSLTFAYSEITGRSYGGGVLTFEPSEISDLPLPLLKENSKIDLKQIDELIREKRIIEVLDIVDNELLIKQLKFSKKEVQLFRNIWLKLSTRRQNRK